MAAEQDTNLLYVQKEESLPDDAIGLSDYMRRKAIALGDLYTDLSTINQITQMLLIEMNRNSRLMLRPFGEDDVHALMLADRQELLRRKAGLLKDLAEAIADESRAVMPMTEQLLQQLNMASAKFVKFLAVPTEVGNDYRHTFAAGRYVLKIDLEGRCSIQ